MGWGWWQPSKTHDLLEARDRSGVMPWYYIGAASFVIVILGCVFALIGILREG